MRMKGGSKDVEKVIWYTKGCKEWELGWRANFQIWLARQFYRLRLISKEDIKEYVYEAIDGALIRKYGDSLVMEHVELK